MGTSGFGWGSPGEQENTLAAREWRQKNGVQHRRLLNEGSGACNRMNGDITRCAKHIYETVPMIGMPGQTYSYNSNHLQMAVAVAVAASGLDVQGVIDKYLITAFNMTRSYYRGQCPDFSVDLMTTGRDYENFLKGLLGYTGLSRRTVDESEKDHTPFLGSFYTLYGDYGFGHFLECFDNVRGVTQACKKERVHWCPGAFGFIPLIDRRLDYYMQVVAAEISPTGSYPLSGIPEY